MDLNQVLSLLRPGLDLPVRVAASIYALATIAGLLAGEGGLEMLAYVAHWASMPPEVASAFTDAHRWVAARHFVFGPVGLALMVGALTQAGKKSHHRGGDRAPAAVLLGASVAVDAGWSLGAIIVGAAVLLLWLGLAIARVIYLRANGGYYDGAEIFAVEEWMRRTWFTPVVAAVYIPVAPFSWLVRGTPSRLSGG